MEAVKELDYKALGKKIKQVRLSRGLTQAELAEMVDCNTSHISNIENDHTKVSLNVLLMIANSLDTTIDYLLSDQYHNPAEALDTSITKTLQNCDTGTKEKILKIVEILVSD